MLPKNANEFYSSSGWQDWGDFLGLMYSFEEARSKLRDIDCNSEMAYKDTQALDPRLPVMPHLYYKNDWKDFDHFLGI